MPSTSALAPPAACVRIVAPLLAWMALACGGNADNRNGPGGDPRGQRMFVGAFQLGSSTGQCAYLVPGDQSSDAAQAICAYGSDTVALTGTYQPTDSIGHGALTLIGTDALGRPWYAVSFFIANAIPDDHGPRLLGGEVDVVDTVGGPTQTRITAQDGTLEPIATYCGSFTHPALPGPGPWLLQIGRDFATGVYMRPDYVEISGPRNGSNLALTAYPAGKPAGTATAILSGQTVSGTFTDPASSTTTGSFTAQPCPGAIAYACCGTSAATRCCFAAQCPCP